MQVTGATHWARQAAPSGMLALHLPQQVVWPRRVSRSWNRLRLVAQAGEEPGTGGDSLRSRLGGLRRDPNNLQQLRASSENLRLLLERRARRQQQQQQQGGASPEDDYSSELGAQQQQQQQRYEYDEEPAQALPVPPAAEEPSVGTALATTASPALESLSAPVSGPGVRRLAKVRFWLKYRAEWGQRLKVIGSHEELGNWQLTGAPELKWSEGDMWHVTADLPAGSIVEYKYVLLDHSGQHAVAWQRGNNSVLAVRQGDDFLEVFDNWGGDPGAKVVSEGQLPTTREGRLLSWAGEIEAQVASQRSELRRARMELVAAQEDAQLARQDASRFRQQLAQAKLDKLAAVTRAKELETANQVLQAQLDDVTKSYRQALETAADLLHATDSAMGQPAAPGSAAAPPKPSFGGGGGSGAALNGFAPAASGSAGGGGSGSGAVDGAVPQMKKRRGRPRRVQLPLPESGVAPAAAAVVAASEVVPTPAAGGKRQRRQRVAGGSKTKLPKAGASSSSAAAAAAAAPEVEAPKPAPAPVDAPTPSSGGGGSGRATGAPGLKGVPSAPAGVVVARSTRARRVKVAAVAVAGGAGEVRGRSPAPPSRGWRGRQRLMLTRDLLGARGDADSAASTEQEE